MVLLIIKILALILTALVVIKSYLSYRSRHESLVMFLFWSLTWVAILLIAFFPDLITATFGAQRIGVGTLLGVSVVFVYFVLYRVYVKADRIEKQLHDIVRQLALKDTDKDSV